MSDGVIRWAEPPSDHGNKKPAKPSKYQPIADALRAAPGQWALVYDGKPIGTCGSLAHRMRYGIGPFAPERSFEAKTVGSAGAQKAQLYARYVGDSPKGGSG
jgi:hypothetical protein